MKSRDATGFRSLLDDARRLDDGGSLALRIEYDLSFFAFHGGGPARPRTFWFGDPCRPRSLAYALVAAIVTFPLCWVGLLFLMFLGEPAKTRHAERVVVVLASVGPVLGLIAATVAWLRARRTHEPDRRVPLLSREGALSAASLSVAAGAGASLGVLLWNTYI